MENRMPEELEGAAAEVERLRAEVRRLRDSRREGEERFRTLLDASPSIIAVAREGVIVYVNAAAVDVLECSGPEEILGMNAMDLVAPAYRTRVEERLYLLGRGSPNPQIELELRKKSGGHVLVESSSIPSVFDGKPAIILVGRDITRQREAERLLSGASREWATTFDAMGDVVCLIDNDNRIKRCNKAMTDFLGLPLRDILGRKCWELFHGSEEPVPDCPVFRMRESRKRESLTLSVKGKWFEVAVDPIFGSDGGIVGAVHIFKDVTDLKEAEIARHVALREAERRGAQTEALLKGTRVVMEEMEFQAAARKIFDYCGSLIGSSSGYVALLSDTGEENEVLFLEAGGLPCTVNPELPMPIRGLRAEAYKTGRAVYHNDFMQSEWAKFMPEGHVNLGNVLFAPLNIGGKTVGIIGLANKNSDFSEEDATIAESFGDIAAIALKNARNKEALAKSERQARAILNSSQEVLALIGPDYSVLAMNEAGAARLSEDPEKVEGKLLSELLPGPMFKRGKDQIDRALKEGARAGFDADWGGMNYRADIWPVFGENREVIAASLYIQDVTDHVRVEREMLKNQKLDSIALLAGGIAHDFNNILSAIMSNVSYARAGDAAKDDIAEALQEAEQACRRAADLTKQLLTFSKGGEPVKKVTSADRLIEESSRFALRGSNVKRSLDIAPGLWNVDIDQGQIAQVFNNLVINANQAMPDGGVVTINAENVALSENSGLPIRPGKYIHVSVTDTGVGISPKHQARIFDPYFTTKQEGSGLGLATAYSIVHKHKGTITVESKPGEGSCFHVYLPACRRGAPAEERRNADDLKIEGRALIMDDEAPVRRALARILGMFGMEVDQAADGAEAVEAYRQAMDDMRPFDLVIMDLTVPGGMGGRTAVEKIIEIDPKAKVIVASGYSNASEMARFKDYGFMGVVTKPVSIESLAETVAAALGSPPR